MEKTYREEQNLKNWDEFRHALWKAIATVYWEFNGQRDCTYGKKEMNQVMAKFWGDEEDLDDLNESLNTGIDYKQILNNLCDEACKEAEDKDALFFGSLSKGFAIKGHKLESVVAELEDKGLDTSADQIWLFLCNDFEDTNPELKDVFTPVSYKNLQLNLETK